ncbi:uncharacterized protein BO95DRAFT_426654 [Aspergillus brunneoviolaceus CBS 621.78]|uniref:Uncharacterized protein n=1 Tax=Aspergillus brunneoviolaceus CBS 621.78 TaxID=1450534 RepID=A0ACD1GQH0_9EURO|nr:hypothetical protein BO95DRAFT_426654 [Aspergillus brunneoviolaceus CBS 621.78]RAH51415.1 hypothetical protein BO95DRAFT_426654 [Aspergillus brunneoviolaceus CBS 621.78]
MSPPVSAPSIGDTRSSESRGSLERKRPRLDDDSDSSDHVRSRPFSWQSSDPLGYALNSTGQSRPIGVESILNPPSKVPSIKPENGWESHGEGQSTAALSSHTRHPSSPTMHLPSPTLHPAKRLSSSPGVRNHPIIAPASPSARFPPLGGSLSLKAGPAQSPLSQTSHLSSYSRGPSSPHYIDSVPGHPVSTSSHPGSAPILTRVSVQSTPTFHSRQVSGSHTPHPSSQETSPTTPVSTYSQFGRSSPAIAVAPMPHHTPSFGNTSYTTGDAASRLPPAMAVPRPGDESAEPPPPGMIPCFVDTKSGSSQQAEKRKANSDASRRFRNRKRNEMQMEQKITAQQDEIRKQAEALQRQTQEIRALTQERDFYRSERDFFRDHYTRLVPAGQMPTRPTSPHAFRTSFLTAPDQDRKAAWHGPEATRESLESARGSAASRTSMADSKMMPLSTARPPVTWPTSSASYGTMHAERGIVPVERPPRELAHVSGAWTRGS